MDDIVMDDGLEQIVPLPKKPGTTRRVHKQEEQEEFVFACVQEVEKFEQSEMLALSGC